MIEEFEKSTDALSVRDPGIVEAGRLLLDSVESLREIIVVIRYWVLQRTNIATGRPFVDSLSRVYPRTAPDPVTLYGWALSNGREDLAFRIWGWFKVAEVLNRQMCNAFDYLIELGLEKFSRSGPTASEIELLRSLVPEASERLG